MFFGGGFGVGLTVADLTPPAFGPPITSVPSLGEVLPVHARTAEEKAAELQRVQRLKAELAAYELELVAAFAADRPASLDRQPGEPGAAADAGDDAAPDGVSEFFPDELALTLNCARASASTLTEHALTLTGPLRATHTELAQGRLDWPRARTIAAELGRPARDIDPQIVAAVEAAVLPDAASLSIRRLKARLRAELAARDAAASDRRRERAHRAVTVTRRPVGDGISELAAGMPDELAAACQATIDELAWRAHNAGDARPIGMLRVGILADLVLRPWLVPEPVAAHLEVRVPLGALSPERFLAAGAPLPPAFQRPEPTGSVAGVPITAAHVRDLLAQLDATGLRVPANGSITFSFTDDAGALQAVATLRELRQAARRGCPEHPGRDCGCSVITRPAPTRAYPPTAPQDRFLTTRDRTCRHPGCDNRAGWADADHVIPHARGGETDCANLCCLCRRHHRLKTFAPGWTYAMTADGILTVTAPCGVTRTSRPPGLQLTGHRVLTRPPDRAHDQPPLPTDPADDLPPF
jgi:hypothetical protein